MINLPSEQHEHEDNRIYRDIKPNDENLHEVHRLAFTMPHAPVHTTMSCVSGRVGLSENEDDFRLMSDSV